VNKFYIKEYVFLTRIIKRNVLIFVIMNMIRFVV